MQERETLISGIANKDKKPDLILVNSPINDYSELKRPDTEQLPAFGLAHIATECEVAGFNVGVLDVETLALSPEDATRIINKENPTWVGINLLTPTYALAKRIVRGLNPDINIAVGGAHAKAMPERTLTDPDFYGKIKVLALEDGEYIMRGILSGVNYSEMGGIAYLDEKTSEYIEKRDDPTKQWIPWELDTLYYADRKFLPGDPFESQNRTETNIVGSRGCPFECTFCAGAKEMLIFGIRNRSTENLIGELILLRKQGITAIRFIDDLFMVNKKRMETFFKAMIDTGLSEDYVWDATARINVLYKLDFDSMLLLAKSGVREISVGAESASQRVLNIMGKGITPDMVRETVKKLAEVGVRTKGYFILGTPSETKDEMIKTIEFMHELRHIARKAVTENPITPNLKPNNAQFRGSMFEFRPYPGTKLYNFITGIESWPDGIWSGYKPVEYSEEQLLEGFKPVLMEGLEVRQKHNYSTELKFTEVAPSEIQVFIAEAMRAQKEDIAKHGEYLPDVKNASNTPSINREVESK